MHNNRWKEHLEDYIQKEVTDKSGVNRTVYIYNNYYYFWKDRKGLGIRLGTAGMLAVILYAVAAFIPASLNSNRYVSVLGLLAVVVLLTELYFIGRIVLRCKPMERADFSGVNSWLKVVSLLYAIFMAVISAIGIIGASGNGETGSILPAVCYLLSGAVSAYIFYCMVHAAEERYLNDEGKPGEKEN